tara:strand:+ start:4159 stop:4401 length:243 start_codon:yes stop_codon:yes gene_type:complete
MIILEIVLKGYVAIALSTGVDELWNINNPRPYPKADYVLVKWEEKDFIKMKDGSYMLRPKRKVDSKLKAIARSRYCDRRY